MNEYRVGEGVCGRWKGVRRLI